MVNLELLTGVTPILNVILKDPQIVNDSIEQPYIEQIQKADFSLTPLDKSLHIYLVTNEERPVGYISLRRKAIARWEIHGGFILEYRGATAKYSVTKAIEMLQEIENVRSITAEIPERNRGAIRILKDLDFLFVGRYREAWLGSDGTWTDLTLWEKVYGRNS